MKIFLDSEFTGLHRNAQLISLGMIAENGTYFYAEFTDYDDRGLDEWIIENVVKNLYLKEDYSLYAVAEPISENTIKRYDAMTVKDSTEHIRFRLEKWLSQFENIEIWSDCLSFDWVLFCDIWKHAFNLPSNIFYIPFDICTLMKVKGIDPDISREEFMRCQIKGNKHNALYDAQVIMACYNRLMKL